MRIRDREEKLIKEDGNNWKILVIDDEQGVIDSINVYLGKMGYIIEGETNPLKGIEKIREKALSENRTEYENALEIIENIY